MNKKQHMMINMSLYTIGIMASKAISFIMLPFNSHYLTVEEFGNYDFAIVICSLLLPVIGLALPETIYRFYNTDKNEEARYGVFCVLIFLTSGILSILASLFLFLFQQEFYILIGLYVFTNIIFLFYQYVIRAKGNVKCYLFSTLINAFLQMIFNIGLILLTELRIEAILLSTIAACVFSIFYLNKKINIQIRIYSRSEYVNAMKELLPYSLPLVPNSLNWWVINSINKLYIKWFCGSGALGVFAMAARFPNFVSSFSTVIYMSSMDTVLRDYDRPERDDTFSDALNFLIQILIPLTAVCIVATKIFIYVFVDSKYENALAYIPILYFSVIVSIFASFFSIIYHCEKKTNKNLETSIYGSISTVILGIIFVYFFGMFGAVFTMLLSNTIIMILRLRDVKRYITLKIDSVCLIKCILLIVFATIGFYLFNGMFLFVVAIIATAFFLLINKKMISYFFKRREKENDSL